MWIKHDTFGFPHNAHHFNLCPRTLLHTVSISDPYHCIPFCQQSYRAGLLSISEIIISQSYTALSATAENKFFVLGSRYCKGMALNGADFTQR
jgi:hypothetical protein